jgi:hypothetical protein
MIKLSDIRQATIDLEYMQERFLRRRGWESSCDFPGAIWLWCKKIRGRQIATDMSHAFSMESYEVEFQESMNESEG